MITLPDEYRLAPRLAKLAALVEKQRAHSMSITTEIGGLGQEPGQPTENEIIAFCDNLRESMLRQLRAGQALSIEHKVDSETLHNGYGMPLDAVCMGATVAVHFGRPARQTVTKRMASAEWREIKRLRQKLKRLRRECSQLQDVVRQLDTYRAAFLERCYEPGNKAVLALLDAAREALGKSPAKEVTAEWSGARPDVAADLRAARERIERQMGYGGSLTKFLADCPNTRIPVAPRGYGIAQCQCCSNRQVAAIGSQRFVICERCQHAIDLNPTRLHEPGPFLEFNIGAAVPSPRCEMCGWPLAKDGEMGCKPGNCSMRPKPVQLYEGGPCVRVTPGLALIRAVHTPHGMKGAVLEENAVHISGDCYACGQQRPNLSEPITDDACWRCAACYGPLERTPDGTFRAGQPGPACSACGESIAAVSYRHNQPLSEGPLCCVCAAIEHVERLVEEQVEPKADDAEDYPVEGDDAPPAKSETWRDRPPLL